MSAIEWLASCFLVGCVLITMGMAWKRSATPKPDQMDELTARRLDRAERRHPSGRTS